MKERVKSVLEWETRISDVFDGERQGGCRSEVERLRRFDRRSGWRTLSMGVQLRRAGLVWGRAFDWARASRSAWELPSGDCPSARAIAGELSASRALVRRDSLLAS